MRRLLKFSRNETFSARNDCSDSSQPNFTITTLANPVVCANLVLLLLFVSHNGVTVWTLTVLMMAIGAD